VTINNLPDEDLLEIFDFYMANPRPSSSYEEDAWHTLVHVCRRWRYVVFGSPRRLGLRLLCMNGRLIKTLDIWPKLPIVIHVDDERISPIPSDLSVLKWPDRVCKIFVGGVPNSTLEELATTGGPWPSLIELELMSFDVDPLVLPDSFLGGSVPSLRSLDLWGIPFSAIRKLLLSTRDLVTLSLGFVPPSGYVSPEAMVAILSALTRLKSIHLIFESSEFWTHGANRSPPARTRVVLPALTNFEVTGGSEYLEDMVSRIDAPLDCISVAFFDQLVSDIPLLCDFIGRTKILNAPHRADTFFSNSDSSISLFQRKGDIDFKVLYLEIPCSNYTLDSQVSLFAQTCSPLLSLPSLEQLCIYKSGLLLPRWQSAVQNTQWMELLRPFITVKDLVLDEPVVLSVASALQALVGEQVTEILPALQNVSLEGFQSSGPVPEGIAKFIGARELSGRPVIVHHQERKL